jgi:protein O-GlcNAc transferase
MRRHHPPPPRRSAAPAPTGPTPAEVHELRALYDSSQWERLERAARTLSARHPAHPVGWKTLGLALQAQGMLPKAAEALSRAARLAPSDANTQIDLGTVLRRLERLSEAEDCYRRALSIRSDLPEAHGNLGAVLEALGRHAEAEACYRKALALRPDHAGLHCDLGIVLHHLDRLPEAEMCYRRALALRPGLAQAHAALGVLAYEGGRFAEAEACYRRAIAIRPDYAEAHTNLGDLLRRLRRLDEAETCIRTAVAVEPDSAAAHKSLGDLLLELGRLAEAEESYRRALEIHPDDARARGSLLFSLNFQDRPPELCTEEARRYGRTLSAQISERFSTWSCTRRPERLRVGLVSGDLREHVVGFFLEGVLAQLDPARIELFAYPTVPKTDALTERLRPCFAAWRPLVGLSDEAAARLIHADGVHVLIDLAGHTDHHRLPVFAWKPAPVQASWLGYFATTGMAEMDWYLADEVGVPAAHRAHFTERVWYLPETRLCFTPPKTQGPTAPLPALQRGFVCFGSFQKLAKINDAVLRAWARILAACPGARLRVQNDSLSDTQAAAAFRERLRAQGIDPTRVELHGSMPRQDYLAAHAEVDILLDTFPFPGGTTTCEALWMGVPTMTLAGETLIARQGASLLTAAGLPDWIAKDEDDYVAKALAYAADLEGLARLRAGLRAQVAASPLFDAARFARHLEEALWGMWHEWAEREGDRP